jgi:hypothetical protein
MAADGQLLRLPRLRGSALLRPERFHAVRDIPQARRKGAAPDKKLVHSTGVQHPSVLVDHARRLRRYPSRATDFDRGRGNVCLWTAQVPRSIRRHTGWMVVVCRGDVYLLLPFVLLQITGLRRAAGLLLALIGMSWGWDHIASHVAQFRINNFVADFPLENWFAFGFGICAYFLVTRTGLVNRLSSRPLAIAADVLTAGAIFLFLLHGVREVTFAWFMLTVCAAAASTVFGRITRFGLIQRFGRYCYSIYLLHFILLYEAVGTITRLLRQPFLAHHSAEVQFAVVYVVVASICLGLGFVAFNFIEKPFVELGRRFVRRLEAGERAAVPARAAL